MACKTRKLRLARSLKGVGVVDNIVECSMPTSKLSVQRVNSAFNAELEFRPNHPTKFYFIMT